MSTSVHIFFKICPYNISVSYPFHLFGSQWALPLNFSKPSLRIAYIFWPVTHKCYHGNNVKPHTGSFRLTCGLRMPYRLGNRTDTDWLIHRKSQPAVVSTCSSALVSLKPQSLAVILGLNVIFVNNNSCVIQSSSSVNQKDPRLGVGSMNGCNFISRCIMYCIYDAIVILCLKFNGN